MVPTSKARSTPINTLSSRYGQPISAQVVERQTGRCMTVNGIVGRHEEAIPVSYLAHRITSLEIRPLMAYIFCFCSAISVCE
jgi:hypothetical protein